MRHPWSAWYWDDWDRRTAHLSHTQYSIYHRLLKHYYRSQKPLVANARDLARVCLAVGAAEEADLQSVLEQFFTLEADGYHNSRADEEIAKAISISNQRAKAGSKGGKQKVSNSVANARHLPVHPQSHNKTPLTPLSGGLTPREYQRVEKELQKIAKAMEGADYDPKDALVKACSRARVEYQRAQYLLEGGAA